MATFYANHLATLADPTTRAVPTLNVHESGGRLRFKRIEIELPDSANNDTVRFASFKSNDVILGIKIYSDDLGTAGTLDLGLAYTGSANDGATIDADRFASAIDVNQAAVNGTEVMSESGVLTADLVARPLWQAAGLTEDPGGNFDLLGTTPAGTTAAGTVTLVVTYSAGD